MSTLIMSNCWPIQGITNTQKSVLISLADQANDDGVCWPSVGTISTRTCLSDRAVQKSIKTLIELGIISISERNGSSNVYKIHKEGCIRFTPERGSPPNQIRRGGEPHSPPPPNEVHPTPERGSPRTVIEPSFEPSMNHHLHLSGKTAKSKNPKPKTLPEDFTPNQKHISIANSLGVNLKDEVDHFKDYHQSKASKFCDWDAAFRTWLRNAKKYQRYSPAPKPKVGIYRDKKRDYSEGVNPDGSF